MLFGLPYVTWAIIACIVPLVISAIPASVWASLITKPALPVDLPKMPLEPLVHPGSAADIAAKAPAKYLAVQKMLLDARTACGECPEAITAIDAAIRATVAMVCKSKTSYSFTVANDWETLGKVPFPMTYHAPAGPASTPEAKQ